ncbi:YaaR family protein [Geobacter sp.]|uniref:YaaR family protein n=1 Tax=Geobacter sp. TaxID=46610 RepID=UPI00262AE3F6|nr:YaaR family protein [Geobacter sp.]
MRINDKLSARDIEKKAKKGSLTKAGEGSTSPFVRALSRRQAEFLSYEQELEELKDEIDRAGSELEREPTIANFKVFRDLIGALTKKVTSHAYRLERIGGNTLNPRCFEIVTVIDREADNLYRLIMTQNKDRLAITNKIMELKGLVVDFLV